MKELRINLVAPCKQLFPPVRLFLPHLGLAYLSSYLKKHLSTKLEISYIMFHPLEFGILRRITSNNPDIIGFSSDTADINTIFNIAQKIKETKNVPLILGGTHITAAPETLSKYIDIGVVREGEQTFLELIKIFIENKRFNVPALEDIKGICFYKDNNIYVTNNREEVKDIDSIPYPDRAIFKLEKELNTPYLFYPVEKFCGTSMLTSRGCPYHCIFCQTQVRWKSVRFNSAEYVVGEIELLRKMYPKINLISIVDDLFLINRPRLEKIVSLIKKKDLDKGLSFVINGRADVVNEEVLELLKLMNVVEMAYGFESGSERILKLLKNNTVTVGDNQRACDLTNKFGIKVSGLFIFGTPGETREDMEMTVDFIKRNRFSRINTAVATPLPRTLLWQMAKEQGFISEGQNMDWSKFAVSYGVSGVNIYINKNIPEKDFIKLMHRIQKLRNNINHPIGLLHYSTYLFWLKILNKLKRTFIHLKAISYNKV